MNTGERIRHLRRIKKMTQGELIQGIASITYLSKVENNQTQPTEQFLKKIAGRLQIQLHVLQEPVLDEWTKKLKPLYEQYWQENKLTEEDLALLHVQLQEPHDNESFLLMYTMLISHYYVGYKLQEAQKLLKQSSHYINFYDDLIDDRYYFHYFLTCGKLFMDLYMLPQAHEYLMRCESYREGASDQDLAKYYFSLSIVKQQLSDDPFVSLYYSEKSLQYQQKIEEPNRLAMVHFARAIQFQLVNQPKDAQTSLQNARACLWDQDNVNLRAIFEYSTGRVYQVGKDYQRAIHFYLIALDCYQKSTFVEKSIQVHKRLVEIYMQEKNWKLVEEHLQQAEQLSEKNKDYYFDIELDILRANAFKLRDQETSYEKAVKMILEHCAERELHYHIKNVATEIGMYFFQKGSYKKSALYYHQAYEAERLQREGV